jgi:hypothetical protein
MSNIGKKTKIVPPAVRLQALALFTMANQNYLRAEAYGKSLAELLGYDDGFASTFGDGWLLKNADFDAVFKNEGFKVRAAKKRKKKVTHK